MQDELEDPAFLAVGPFSVLREMKQTLAAAGVSSEIVQPPDGNVNA